jgi:hypothetical protein
MATHTVNPIASDAPAEDSGGAQSPAVDKHITGRGGDLEAINFKLRRVWNRLARNHRRPNLV